jgi:hypothetical protein
VKADKSDGHPHIVDERCMVVLAGCNYSQSANKDVLPPAVIKYTSQVNTVDEALLHCRNDKKGKSITTQKHQIGTPFAVQYERNLGARPSSESPYKLRTAA